MKRLPEVLSVYRRRKEVHVRMLALFGTVQAWPPGEDDICPLQKLLLAPDKLRRCKVKGGKFVHTVEND